MSKSLNEGVVAELTAPAAGNRVYFFAGARIQGSPVPRGFGVRVTAGGAKAFVLNYRHQGRERRFTIGRFPDWSVIRAVREARDLRQRVDRGENLFAHKAQPAEPKTINDILTEFVERHVRNKDRPLRTADEYESAFDRLVRPAIGKIAVYELRRSDVAKMLDRIEDANGPVMADRARAYLRKALGWYAERDDKFNINSAIVRVAPRSNSKDRARTRVLSDFEISAIWKASDDLGVFGALVKTLFLTAQRRDEVARMTYSEIGDDGIWTIPPERYKTKRANHVPLSKQALAIIHTQPKVSSSDYVFASSAGTPFSGFSKKKNALDRTVRAAQKKEADRVLEQIPNWRLHDVRRTAKTLMQRAGVRPDISERVLGHVIAGVEGTYDRYGYEAEKRDALDRLAEMIERIASKKEGRGSTSG